MLPLTKTNRPSPKQEKQPQTITLTQPNFTFDMTQHTLVNTARQASGRSTHANLSGISRTVTHHSRKPSSTTPNLDNSVVCSITNDGEHSFSLLMISGVYHHHENRVL